VLCYKSEGRWFDPSWCHWYFSLTKSFCLHYGPGVNSVCDRNEYHEHFLGVKVAGAQGWQPYRHPVPLLYLGISTSGTLWAFNRIALRFTLFNGHI